MRASAVDSGSETSATNSDHVGARAGDAQAQDILDGRWSNDEAEFEQFAFFIVPYARLLARPPDQRIDLVVKLWPSSVV